MSEKVKIDFEKGCENCIDSVDVEKFVTKQDTSSNDNVYVVSGVAGHCAQCQKENGCRALAAFKDSLIPSLRGKKKNDVEVCVECCRSHEKEVPPDYMEMVQEGNDSSYCPLKREKYDSKDKRDDACQNKLLKVMKNCI